MMMKVRRKKHEPESNQPDGAVKGARTKRQALAHVMQKQITIYFTLFGHTWNDSIQREANGTQIPTNAKSANKLCTKHRRADVHPDPLMPLITEHFTAEAASAADIKQQTRFVFRQIQQLDGTLGHFGLNFDDARTDQTNNKDIKKTNPFSIMLERWTYFPAYFLASPSL